jgi:hypothetical protein
MKDRVINLYLFGSEVVTAMAMKSYMNVCFMLDSCSAYTSALTMEAICSSELSVHFHRTARHYIPEDRTIRIVTHMPIARQRLDKHLSETDSW